MILNNDISTAVSLVAGHRSVETGQKVALDFMGLEPMLDLDLRLGEGTGAAITINLAELSCRMMREMASFEEAGVDAGESRVEKSAGHDPVSMSSFIRP